MDVVIRQLRHGFHNDRKLLHLWNVLNHVKLGSSDSDVSEEVKKQIISGSYSMNIRNRRILGADFAAIRRFCNVKVLKASEFFK